jgi:1,4-dihydroxy-2-naphthoyl-CoA synthase
MSRNQRGEERMNNKQQTAVEWFAGRQYDLESLRDVGAISIVLYYEQLTQAVQQAKEMEKEQIKKAYCYGEHYKDTKLTTDYYNETYGGNK